MMNEHDMIYPSKHQAATSRILSYEMYVTTLTVLSEIKVTIAKSIAIISESESTSHP